MPSSNTPPPTLFTSSFTPLPSVAFITASTKPAPRTHTPTSRPSLARRSSLACEPEVPITRAPRALAICMLATPTPDDTPVTRIQSPAPTTPASSFAAPLAERTTMS